MAFTGIIPYYKGARAPRLMDLRAEGVVEDNHGTPTLEVSIPATDAVPNLAEIEVHAYQNGLLLHIMGPRGTWVVDPRRPHRLFLIVED